MALLPLLLPLTAPAATPADLPAHATTDLLRVQPGGARIYVQAALPDGSLGLFLVDTGANVSLLSTQTAARLGLDLDRDVGSVVGLGGEARMDRATLPTLSIGEATLRDVEFAVGVPGLSTRAGAMELDGLLGNNIWANFTVELDYPADTLVLHRPDALALGPRDAAMVFDGSHIAAPIELGTTNAPGIRQRLLLRLDTGAGDLSICGQLAEALDATWTEGVEPVLGLGASATLPPFRNLRKTRRLEVADVRIAGRRVPEVTSARWMDFDRSGTCPTDLSGLAGHALLQAHRVILDYQRGAMRLGPSRRPPRQVDGHAIVLSQELQRGSTAERALYRARLRLALQQSEAAGAELELARQHEPSALEATVLLAELARYQGQPDASLALLQSLDTIELIEAEAIVQAVNTLALRDRAAEALALAQAATQAQPDTSAAWVALSDARLAMADAAGAQEALLRAVQLERFGDAHLLRRARVAAAAGDRDAALAHARRLLQLYPMGGEFLWFYTLLAESEDHPTLRVDIERAVARLHPSSLPLDFLAAAEHRMGDPSAALARVEQGLARDCQALDRGPARDNCRAWYWSLVGTRGDEALTAIQRALAAEGDRADYLDTLAVVRMARGELAEAAAAARAAALLSPTNVYALWQADRMAQLAQLERSVADTPR